jgi:hypothetical protein
LLIGAEHILRPPEKLAAIQRLRVSHRTFLSALLTLWLIFTCAISQAEITDAQFAADLDELTKSSSRFIGTSGYYAAADYVEREIQKSSNVQLRRHEFTVMVPVTQRADLDIGNGQVERVYPFWPAQLRVCSTPPEGIRGNLVYAGECGFYEIKPMSLKGNIAVIEASAGSRWTEAASVGAKAILVLGGSDTSWHDLQSHELRVPVNFPRFYVPPGALADTLRAGRIPQATLTATVRWQRTIARNIYALIPPARKISQGWNDSQPPAALMFSVPLDATSLVPDLAPGASQAVQAASGLALVRQIANHPWDRPVVVCFSSADGIQMLGTRNMLMALAEPPANWADEMSALSEQIDQVQSDQRRAREIAETPQKLSSDSDERLVQRITTILEADLAEEQDELFRLRISQAGRTASGDEDSRRKQLESHQIALNQLKYILQQKPEKLDRSEHAAAAREYLAQTIARLDRLAVQCQARRSELTSRIELYHWLADAIGRQREPQRDQTDTRLIELVVALDLSDRGTRVGPLAFGFFQRASGLGALQDYREWFDRAEKTIPAAIDLAPLRQQSAPSTYLAGPLALSSELTQVFATPSVSFITLDDQRPYRDTPADTLDHINVRAILPQLAAVRELFQSAAADPRFRSTGDLKRLNADFVGQVVMASADRPVPDLPREGSLVTYSYVANKEKKVPQLGALPFAIGVRRTEVHDCDAEGNYRFEGLPRLKPQLLEGASKLLGDMQVFAVTATKLDEKTGAVIATTDLGKQAVDNKFYVDIKQKVLPVRSVLFNCEEFSLLGLYDPRFLQSLAEVIPLDARRGAEPLRYSMWLGDAMLAGFAEPGTPLDLLIRYGRVGNRLILINAHEPPRGKDGAGYTPRELHGLAPLSLATSRDFYQLDDRRLNSYRKAGVSSALIDDLHREAGEQIDAATESLHRDDGAGLLRSATSAWATEARVYDAAQSMARDIVRGAIFMLLLLVPFSFCLERLIVATPSVYKQLAAVTSIFALMVLALWSFHPAFRISASPLIIVLAFAIIFMSAIVLYVVYGKFDSELKQIKSTRGTGEGASVARSSVLMSAVMLGLANMRKRKFRTALTSITIVLITFAVLCFTSTSRYIGTTTFETGANGVHPAILLRQRGFRPIPQATADQVRALLCDHKLDASDASVIERWWAVSSVDPKEQYRVGVATSGTVFPVQAVLGVSRNDALMWRTLSGGEAPSESAVYVPRELADRFNLHPNDHVRIGGLDANVAGVFDSAKFDLTARSAAGESLTPLRYGTGEVDANGRRLDDTSVESLELSGSAAGAEAGINYDHLPSSEVAIVPAELCSKLYNSRLRELEIHVRDDAQVKAVSEAIAHRFSLAIFASPSDGVRMISASNLASVSGAGAVAVPLLIAGLIIFNTMMGSIAERKREIHVYTSLGLAPFHVGALFLAEAAVYGLIGVVAGYIGGQGLATLMQKLGWLGNVTLNYSGSAAMLSMALVLAIVLLSALLPARLASKLAAPSIDRTWQVPQPVDGEIAVTLPFTINKTAADGVLAYLVEFFAAHREGTVGNFSADQLEIVRIDVLAPKLNATVWLTPFDLGVRQRLSLTIHPGVYPDIYEVDLKLHRLSGDDQSWYRQNRPFLTELRQQFLQWRSLTPARMMEYVKQSRRLLSAAEEMQN